MRSDVGIVQPMWESEVERIQKLTDKNERNWERAWENVVKNYPWDKLDFRYKPETSSKQIPQNSGAIKRKRQS
jgi:hypothetical protein